MEVPTPPGVHTNLSDAETIAALTSTSTFTPNNANDPSSDAAFIVCYSPTMITTNGLWQGDNPLDYSLPLFILQTILVVVVTRSLNVVLSRYRQPRFVAEVLGGIILGPSVLGKIPNYIDIVFPTRSMAVLETMANLGLVYFIFLVGLHVDLHTVNRAGQKAWVLTGAAVGVPFLVQALAFFVFGNDIRRKDFWDAYLIFVGVSTTITAYPVLARILAELKLLHTETGKMAMSSAILNDGIAWILLAIAIALTGKHRSYMAPVYIVGSGLVFVVVVYYTVRPTANWIMAHTQDGEALDEVYVVLVLLAVMVCGILADAVGIHAVFGAFTMGVVIPNGPLVAVLMEKLEDFVSGFLLPLFFAVVGIRFDTRTLEDPEVYGFLIGVIFLAAATRVAVVTLVTMCYGATTRDGLALGVLMNTKGIMELIVLHIALDKKVLYTQSYTAMILSSVILTCLVTPLTMIVHRPSRQLVTYKRRTIQRSKPDSELRMLTCIHSTRNVPSVISVLEVSNPTKRSPIFVYAVHLVELTGRESAMLIVHDTHKTHGKRRHGPGGSGQGNLNRVQAQSDQIMKAFESYEQHAGGVSVQQLTVVSAYPTMHEDICSLAEDKHAAFLILPFHKQHTVDGGMEVTNPGIRTVNHNVLANAPCSVGILVDRGLGGTARIIPGHQVAHHVALLFFGGPDDREALAYASRIADHPGISLTVLRFVEAGSATADSDYQVVQMNGVDQDKERWLDDDCIKDFRIKTMSDESVVYMEKVVANGEETVAAIRDIDSVHDLYIVGRGEGVESPLTAGLTDWTESPELGAIGDLLSSSDFTTTVSVLVIQQYKGATHAAEGMHLAPDSPGQQSANKGNSKWSFA